VTAEDAPLVRLVDHDPDSEVKLVRVDAYPYTHLPETQVEDKVRAMSVDERLAVVRAYTGDRSNRRHKPGRALERTRYRFDVLADYGAFRDLQRHRMLTVEWQPLSPRHGYTRPERSSSPVTPPRSTPPWNGRRRSMMRWSSGSRAGVVRGLLGVQGSLRARSERAGGDAPHRAAFHPAGASAYRVVAQRCIA